MSDYCPDPSVCDYEPEYSTVNDAWLNNYKPPPFKRKKEPHPHRFILLPQTCIDTNCHDVFPEVEVPKLGFIPGGVPAALPRQRRRDGASIIVDCAARLEHACAIFDREADEESLVDVEPQLRRAVRAVNNLTRKASRARHRMQVQRTLFDD